MEFSLLDLKNFGTLFPNKNITDVAYTEAVNQYINDKLVTVKNINGLSGNELIKKKKDYINTYILPLMNLLFSKYYIQYNNLNILVNKNNSILLEFNNLKLFYSYNNPIINSVNVYFYKKYSGLNKNNRNKENKSLIDINTLTIMANNKTEIVTNLTEYIDNLTFENKKIKYKDALKTTITGLVDKMNGSIVSLNKEYSSISNNSKKFNELTLSIEPNNIVYKKLIDDINKFLKEILNKVIYYHEKTTNVSKLISDINNILKDACSILIKTKIDSSITINITISLDGVIVPLNKINEIYEKQIKLYKNYISSNKSNNNIKKITQENLINFTKTYYDEIKKAILTVPTNNQQNNLFIKELFTFIKKDNILTNKFIINNNNNNDKENINKLDEILPKLKEYKEILKLNLNSKNIKNTIINNDTLQKFFKNEKDFFQNFLTEIGASNVSETNKKDYEGLKTQNDIFDKINTNLDEIKTKTELTIGNTDYKKNLSSEEEYNVVKDLIDNLNNIIKQVNSNIKNTSIISSGLKDLDIKKIYIKKSSTYDFKIQVFKDSVSLINSSIESIKKAINDKKSTNQSKIVKYANYWINTYSKIIIKEFPDNYENSSYKEIIPIFDRPIKNNIKKYVNNLYDSFIKIDTKLINDINESTKKIQKNRLRFYLTQDTQFNKIEKEIKEPENINSSNKLISSYIFSFKNKNVKQNLFINQIKNDNKSISSNPDIQQFLSTIYTYNDTLIANLASKINNSLIKNDKTINNEKLKTQINKFKNEITTLFTKITNKSSINNKTSTLNNKTPTLNNNKNKNLIYIPAYTDVIQLYFMNLIFIKLLFTNSS